jgi:hypothetical protein
MSILFDGVRGFFDEAVGSAIEARKVEASTGVREYLVGVLVDFAATGRPPEALQRPVTFLLDEALRAPPAERFEKLKDVGDGTLYMSGIFVDHLNARGIDVGYVSSVGATAYGTAASMLQKGDGIGIDVFGELAAKFARLVDVLHDVADAIFAGSPDDPASIVKLYEKWQRTGSQRLGRELIVRGLVPMKPAGGVQ